MNGTCPLCGAKSERVLSRVLRRGRGIVFHCEDCDLGFLVPAPPFPGTERPSRLAYYSNAYRRHVSHRADGGPTTPEEIFDAYRNYQQQRLDAVLPHVNEDSRVLEIGASVGQFLVHLEGKCARRCAIEPDTACCAFMDSLGIETSFAPLPDSRFQACTFDLVLAFQTMEHVADPIAFLCAARGVMAAGAHAFIEVPSLADPLLTVWNVPAYEEFYYHEDHLTYWSARALRRLAHKAGFDPVRTIVRPSQDYNLLNALHWQMCGTPQIDCHAGLRPVALPGKDRALTAWLGSELRKLNAEYIRRLEAQGTTSNLMLCVRV